MKNNILMKIIHFFLAYDEILIFLKKFRILVNEDIFFIGLYMNR
jgi:hypothetical protein